MTTMRLNTMSPAEGSKKTAMRVGRGIGCGKGKTCGKGHKGQSARAGGYHKVGFEGGQMPLQRRLPKFGFNSRLAASRVEVRLHELMKVESGEIDQAALVKAGVVSAEVKVIKIIASGKITKPVIVKALKVTKGAKAAIVAAGGKVIEG